jgi:Lar family restriction alleviation protein
MEIKLEPCPFCASQNVAFVEMLKHVVTFVRCDDCNAEGPPKHRHHSGLDHGQDATRAAAAALWNNRAITS